MAVKKKEVNKKAVKKKVTKSVKGCKGTYTHKQLLKILTDAIEAYRVDLEPSYHKVIQRNCVLDPHSWDFHRRKHDDIGEQFTKLKSIQIEKIISGGMTGEYNSTFSMFMLKCKHGFIEEQHKQANEINNKAVNVQSNVIEIGFTNDSED